MKIVHICLCGPVTDGFNYQDNLISKYHVKLGHDVTLLASEWIWNKKGKLTLTNHKDYVNDDGVHMIRLPIKLGIINNRLKIYKGLYHTLEQESPDILFVHGVQFLDVFQVAKYAQKHPNVTVYVDNHADFSNSATTWLSKNILHKILWRICAHSILPYAAKFYGVLPARVDFLINLYHIPKEKCELLVMGADDDLVVKTSDKEKQLKFRQKYGIEADDFLIVTGGKIDVWKTQTLLLMKAIRNIKRNDVKLIIFGSVADSIKRQFDDLLSSDNIQYIGWVNSEQSYLAFASANLVIFPGRHSVYWEQAAGEGIPLIVKDWPGTHHVDLGGNVRFLMNDSVEEIQGNIEFLLDHPDVYDSMKKIAQDKGMSYFSYKEIAKRSIEQ
jgi:glycosyltransferase involved in cell wall biosynthesis